MALAALVLDKNDPQVSNIFNSNTVLTSSSVALSKINEASVYTLTRCETSCSQITDVNCAIENLVEAGIKSSMEKIVSNNYDTKLSNDPLYGLSKKMLFSTDKLDATLRNNTFQMISTSCLFKTNQIISNNYVYVGTGAKTGAISFAQSSEISSIDCVVDTIAKNNSFQTDDTSNSANVLGLAITIVIVIMIIFITIIIFYILSGKRKRKIPKLDRKIYLEINNNKNIYSDYSDMEFR